MGKYINSYHQLNVTKRININMNNKETLVSRQVSQRIDQDSKLKQGQQKQLDNRAIQRDSNDFYRSVSAVNDEYMKSALMKVRESKVTHNDELLRRNGTWQHNMKNR